MARIRATQMYGPPDGDLEGELPQISLHGEPCKRKDVYAIACAMTVEVGRSRKVYQTDDEDVVRVPQTFKQTSVGSRHGEALRYMLVIGRIMRTACSCGSLTGDRKSTRLNSIT